MFSNIKNKYRVSFFFILFVNFYFCRVYAFDLPEKVKHEFELVKDKEECKLMESEVSKRIGKKDLDASSEIREKKVFIGNSRFIYNQDDYYLWASSYDIDNNATKDLIAIDWHSRGNNKYYLAVYVWLNKGILFTVRRKLSSFLLEQSLGVRHSKGVQALIPESFRIIDYTGNFIEESFVGYHVIRPIVIDDKLYILAEREVALGASRLLFNLDQSKKRIELECKF